MASIPEKCTVSHCPAKDVNDSVPIGDRARYNTERERFVPSPDTVRPAFDPVTAGLISSRAFMGGAPPAAGYG